MTDKAKNGKLMKMEILSQRSGYSISTIYEYLRNGLLHSPRKEGPTKSRFDSTHLKRLIMIRDFREKEQLTLTEIKKRFETSIDVTQTEFSTEQSIRIQIVDKALTLFAKQHLEKTKISDITDALNMGSGTFYRYFKSKEDLFLDCLERLPSVLVPEKAWEEVERETDYIKRLRKRAYAMLNAIPSYIGMLNYAKLALGSEDRKLSEKAAQCLKSLVYPLKKDLQDAISKGRVRKINEDLTAYLLMGIYETFCHSMLIDNTFSVDEGFTIIEDFVKHALYSEMSKKNDENKSSEKYFLTDIDKHKISVHSLRFNENTYLPGRLYQGQLNVHVEDISTVSLIMENDVLKANVLGKTGKIITIQVSADILVSGITDMGQFVVPIEKIRMIDRVK